MAIARRITVDGRRGRGGDIKETNRAWDGDGGG